MLVTMADQDPNWLGELRWQGYPRLDAVRDVASAIEAEDSDATQKRSPEAGSRPDPAALETEPLRARLETLTRLSVEFERRLSEAGTAHESAILEAESRLRDAALERER